MKDNLHSTLKMTIKKLVEHYLHRKEESKTDLVRQMGYRNINKGLRRLDECLATGRCTEVFLKTLARVLDTDLCMIRSALWETRRNVEAREEASRRRHFRPHIRILHSLKVPVNITAVAFAGIHCFKVIPTDRELIRKSLWEQIEEAREIIQQHFIRSEGRCPLFGRITGYRYFYSFDEWVELDTEGTLLGYHQGKSILPTATLKIGGRLTGKGIPGKNELSFLWSNGRTFKAET